MQDSCSAVAPGEGSRVSRRGARDVLGFNTATEHDLRCLAYLGNWHNLDHNVRENRYVVRPWYADARPVAGLSDRGRGGQLRGCGAEARPGDVGHQLFGCQSGGAARSRAVRSPVDAQTQV